MICVFNYSMLIIILLILIVYIKRTLQFCTHISLRALTNSSQCKA